MEDRLLRFRKQNKKKENFSPGNMFLKIFSYSKVPTEEEKDEEELEQEVEVKTETETSSLKKWILYILYFLLWITFYSIALYYQFGAVYFVLSTLIIIYLNTSTRKRVKDEPSAYSVFNKNCESIDGAISAEQFEKEIRFGAVNIF